MIAAIECCLRDMQAPETPAGLVTPRRYAAGRTRGGAVRKLPPTPLSIKHVPDRFADTVRVHPDGQQPPCSGQWPRNCFPGCLCPLGLFCMFYRLSASALPHATWPVGT